MWENATWALSTTRRGPDPNLRRGGHLCRVADNMITLCDPFDKWRLVVLR